MFDIDITMSAIEDIRVFRKHERNRIIATANNHYELAATCTVKRILAVGRTIDENSTNEKIS